MLFEKVNVERCLIIVTRTGVPSVTMSVPTNWKTIFLLSDVVIRENSALCSKNSEINAVEFLFDRENFAICTSNRISCDYHVFVSSKITT